MRSRAVILPLACCFSTALAEPGVDGLVDPAVQVGELALGGVDVDVLGDLGALDPAVRSRVPSLFLGSCANLVAMTDHEDSRPPLDVAAAGVGGRWRVEVVETSGSTNADVADRFRAGEGEGLVLVAEDQTAGRGRLGREWVTPPRAR